MLCMYGVLWIDLGIGLGTGLGTADDSGSWTFGS